MHPAVRTGLAPLVVFTMLGAPLVAQFDPSAPEPLMPVGGTVFLGGGGDLPAEVFDRFVQLAGGDKDKLVVVTVSDTAVVPEPLAGVTTVSVTSGKGKQLSDAVAAVGNASGVWLVADTGEQLAAMLRDSVVETALHGLLLRKGVLGANGDVVRAFAQTTITGGEVHAKLGKGLDLIPGVVIDPYYSPASQQSRLLGVLAGQPRLVGLGIESSTVLVLHNRWFDVFGEGSGYACIAANLHLPVRVERLHADVSPRTQRRARAQPRNGGARPRRRGRQRRTRDQGYRPKRLEDLLAMSRAALARTRDKFPADKPPEPNVAKGSLMIVGGGGSPSGFMDKFMELAGGKDALLLYIPCTESETATAERTLERWRKAGATNVDFIHTKDRHLADTSEQIHAKLRKAGGLFFGGGRQWNLVDSWQHTEAHRLMHEVLARGGVIAGSSAGASIQGSYMARGNSLGNVDSMAAGYETGLGFLTGVAIDQHFTQRGRQPDMTKLVNRYPQLLGIGLDEASSIIVQGSIATCFSREGRNVHFYDRNLPVVPGQPDYLRLKNGQRFNLATRKVQE